jgi:uncharacterized protein YjcR
LDKEVKRATARRDKAAAMLKAEDAALEALLKAQAELFEAVAEEHRSEVLHDKHNSSTLKHMDAAISQKRIGRPVTSKHPFPARCVELGLSIKDAAEKLDVSPSTLRSWYASPPDGRPIPPAMVDVLSRVPWNIPPRAWRNRPSR